MNKKSFCRLMISGIDFDDIEEKLLNNVHVDKATTHCGGYATRMAFWKDPCRNCKKTTVFPSRQIGLHANPAPRLCANCDELFLAKMFQRLGTCGYGNPSCECAILNSNRHIFKLTRDRVVFVSGCFEGCIDESPKKALWTEIVKKA